MVRTQSASVSLYRRFAAMSDWMKKDRGANAPLLPPHGYDCQSRQPGQARRVHDSKQEVESQAVFAGTAPLGYLGEAVGEQER